MTFLLLALVGVLAFANGANDNGKGVATLVGYGAASPKRALLFATITTAIGAGLSFWLAGGMISTFSTGLFAKGAPTNLTLFVSVLIGACGWMIFATRTGLPVSTTHAITGGLCGAGMVAFGSRSIAWSVLGAKFAVPLALSPLLSLAIVYALAWPVMFVLRKAADRCVCVVENATVTASGTANAQLQVIADSVSACAAAEPIAAVQTSAVANALHWTCGGLVGFARGWNDAPKIAALAIVALPDRTGLAFAWVTVAMALGGVLAGRKVLETLAKKVTTLPLAESLTASFASAVLVGLASWRGLPVSTTHVTTGGIIGAGLARDPAGVKWKKVGEIAISWIVTVPVAAIVAAGAQLLLHRIAR